MSPERTLLEASLADPACAWSLGTYGAIAEFMRTPDETVVFGDDAAMTAAHTERGAIRIAFDRPPRLIAHETPSRTPGRWSHGIAACLPAAEAAMPGRTVVTELGPDIAAVREEDREAILFDMGVGAPHVDFCIRTRDAELVDLLRRHAGASLAAEGSPVGEALLAAQPHRVTVSRLGRIEVYQPFATPEGRTPAGPHTHLLPHLLATGRTHAETTPVPAGYFSCLEAYPASPIHDMEGNPVPFDAMRHVAFEVVLKEHGLPDYVLEKERLRAAFAGARPPESYETPRSDLGRAAVKVALRQLAVLGSDASRLAPWLAAFDGAGEASAAGH
jgi:hypothetical protein